MNPKTGQRLKGDLDTLSLIRLNRRWLRNKWYW
jgi:hypothetical protein